MKVHYVSLCGMSQKGAWNKKKGRKKGKKMSLKNLSAEKSFFTTRRSMVNSKNSARQRQKLSARSLGPPCVGEGRGRGGSGGGGEEGVWAGAGGRLLLVPAHVISCVLCTQSRFSSCEPCITTMHEDACEPQRYPGQTTARH